MITLDDVELNWKVLEAEVLEGSELRVRELDGFDTVAGKTLFAIDVDGNRHLLMPMPSWVRGSKDKRSSGVHISVHRLVDSDENRSFSDVVCLKPHLNKLFSIILSEILNLVPENPQRPDIVAVQVLNRWRELLDHEPSQLPEMERLTGLFAELLYLREIIRINPARLMCWTGPAKGRHDFVSSTLNLEVKATQMRRGRIFTIHGHNQLEAPLGIELYLAAVQLEQSPTGESLPELVESIVSLGADRYSLLLQLAKVGISLDILALCEDIRFQVTENRVYVVTENFPKITSSSFKDDCLPNGIRSLQYEIDLSTEPPYPLEMDIVLSLYQRLAME